MRLPRRPRAGAPTAGHAGRAPAEPAAPRPGGSPKGGGGWLVGTFSVAGLVGCVVIGYAVLHHPATPAETCTAAPATPSTPPPAPAPSKTAKPLPPGPSALPINTRVTVRNGSGVDGASQFVLTWMQNTQGYLRTSNGGSARTTATTSLVYAPNHIDQARTLAAAMHLPPYTLHGTGKGTGLRDPMILTLGKDFRTAGKPLAPPPTPTPTTHPDHRRSRRLHRLTTRQARADEPVSGQGGTHLRGGRFLIAGGCGGESPAGRAGLPAPARAPVPGPAPSRQRGRAVGHRRGTGTARQAG